MSDTHSTESTPSATTQTPLPNDVAARSATGEILDVRDPPKPTTTETKPTTESTPAATTSADSSDPKPAPDGTPAPKPTEPAKPAPEAYTDFKLPEGLTLAKETIDAATPIFRELGLDQAAAQRLVDFHAAEIAKLASGPKTAFETLNADWSAKTAADPELKAYATEGQTGLDAVKVDIGKAYAAINNPTLTNEFKDIMNKTGVGNHPAFVKMFWKLSQFVTEGKSVSGSGPSVHGQRDPAKPARPSAAQAMYPNLPSAAG